MKFYEGLEVKDLPFGFCEVPFQYTDQREQFILRAGCWELVTSPHHDALTTELSWLCRRA